MPTSKHSCHPSVRTLYAWEIQEAQRVFGDRLNWDAIHIHECTKWLKLNHWLGSILKITAGKDIPNAVTLGYHLYFPVKLLPELVPPDHAEHYKISWLIHELTHVWQFQNLGWCYLILALKAQIRLGRKAYDFGGKHGLQILGEAGRKFTSFNPEQQGDIARTYYERLVRGLDITSWEPFIEEIRSSGKLV